MGIPSVNKDAASSDESTNYRHLIHKLKLRKLLLKSYIKAGSWQKSELPKESEDGDFPRKATQ